MMMEKKFCWKGRRVYFGFLLFWLLSSGGAGLLYKAGHEPNVQVGWILLCILPFILLPLFSDRSWKIKGKLLWLITIFPLMGISYATFGMLGIFLCALANKPELADRAAHLFSFYPIVLFTMRRSKIFVELLAPHENNRDHS